jgi:hypothetical protein
MLRWLRVRSRAVAAAVLFSVALLSTAAPHASEGHDEHGAATFAPHDPDAHRVGGTSPEGREHERHCAICHLTRSLRPDPRTGHQLSAPADRPVTVHVPTFRTPLIFPAAQPPLRSPPASPALVA